MGVRVGDHRRIAHKDHHSGFVPDYDNPLIAKTYDLHPIEGEGNGGTLTTKSYYRRIDPRNIRRYITNRDPFDIQEETLKPGERRSIPNIGRIEVF